MWNQQALLGRSLGSTLNAVATSIEMGGWTGCCPTQVTIAAPNRFTYHPTNPIGAYARSLARQRLTLHTQSSLLNHYYDPNAVGVIIPDITNIVNDDHAVR